VSGRGERTLKGLQGDADTDRNGHVTLEDRHAYVKRSIQREAGRLSREHAPQPSVLNARPDELLTNLSRRNRRWREAIENGSW
jgi:hypothetical protein